MANIYGELISAQLENNASDPGVTVTGKVVWQTTLNKIRYADGTIVRSVLSNDQYCVFGTNGTAANNIRLNRAAAAVLQFVTGDDTTAEGSLATSLAQLSFRAETYATGSLPAAGNEGRITFDTTTKQLKFDNGTSWTAAGGATAALDNLASTAVNTDIISDTDSTDDLGSAAIAWANGYFDSLHLESGVEVLPTNHLHVAGDFPNTTNFYAWHNNGSGDYDDGDWTGSKALTENGALTSILSDASVNDVLGNDTFCYFDGSNDYLSSADAVFDAMTGDFSVSLWAYHASWAAASLMLASKTDNATGWYIALIGSGDIVFHNVGAGVNEAVGYVNTLAPGWHHIAVVRDDGTSTALYVDGKVAAYTNLHAAIVDAGNLEFGSFNGGNNKWVGGIQEMAIDVDTAWTANEVRKIYAASCQKFVTEETANVTGSKISIHDGRHNNGHQAVHVISAAIAFNEGAWANATGFTLLVPENGWYRVFADMTIYTSDASQVATNGKVRLYDGTADLPGATVRLTHNLTGGNGDYVYLGIHLEYSGYFAKDTVITVQTNEASGDDNSIQAESDVAEPIFALEKLN